VSPPDVTTIILHPDPPAAAGPLVLGVATARAALAERHRAGFQAAGAHDVQLISGPPDARPFGARLRAHAARLSTGDGLIVLGSGALPLATRRDRSSFVEAAAGLRDGRALANNRYSADIVAIPRARQVLADVPDLPTDNALPRWLTDIAGLPVDDLGGRWRLAMDIDSALDLVVLGGRWATVLDARDRAGVEARIAALRAVTTDPRAELVVSGRTSPSTLTWLTRATASRTRALIEERGLRTSTPVQRAAASVLGLLLERDGPGALATVLARLGEAAVVDTRVLLAHRLGADQARWPTEEDRFASDLLLHERITDPWFRELTRSAAEASVPILLGAHSLVGPGLRLLVRPRPGR
jgi:hypothetical protein